MKYVVQIRSVTGIAFVATLSHIYLGSFFWSHVVSHSNQSIVASVYLLATLSLNPNLWYGGTLRITKTIELPILSLLSTFYRFFRSFLKSLLNYMSFGKMFESNGTAAHIADTKPTVFILKINYLLFSCFPHHFGRFSQKCIFQFSDFSDSLSQ